MKFVSALVCALFCAAAVVSGAQETAKWSYGVDISTAASVDALQCLKHNHPNPIDYIVIRGGRSTGKPDTNVADSLKHAQAANFAADQLGVYIFPCPKCEMSGADQVKQMMDHITHAGAQDLFTTIWLDIEGGPLYWKSTPAENVAFFQSMLKQAKTYLPKYKIGIYTSKSQWAPIVGNDHTANDFPIWYAGYNRYQSFEDFKPFAGWQKPTIHQYAGDVSMCGIGVDLNVMTGGKTLLENTIQWSVPNGGKAPVQPDLNPACTALKGSCIDTAIQNCVGSLKPRLCPASGPSVLCCIPRATSAPDPAPGCTALGGTCMDTSKNHCVGTLKKRVCPAGGENVQCCVGRIDVQGRAPNPACTDVGGICIPSTDKCEGVNHHGNFCSGIQGKPHTCCISSEGPHPPHPGEPEHPADGLNDDHLLPPMPPPPAGTLTDAQKYAIDSKPYPKQKKLKRRVVPEKKVRALQPVGPAHIGPGPIPAGAAPAPLNSAALGGESMGSTIRRADPKFSKRLPNVRHNTGF